jgi:Pvc16 N-terminal domain
MSGHLALNVVSGVLRDLVVRACAGDPVLGGLIRDKGDVSLANPTETAAQSHQRISLWLYRITENEFLKNLPAAEPGRVSSLALDLHYLVTPFTGNAENDQVLLGRVLQALHENASVYVSRPADPVVEEIRVVFSRLPLEEVTRIWEALQEPYRLSVCYLVRVVRIDAERLRADAPVVEVTTGTGTGVTP